MMLRRGHLDLSTTVKTTAGPMEGVLGATYAALKKSVDPASSAFYDEGHESSYMVAGLFDRLPVKPYVSRRLQGAKGQSNAVVIRTAGIKTYRNV